MMTFEVMTPENTQRVTFTGIAGRYADGEFIVETWDIGKSPQALAYALLCFARTHNTTPRDVQYSVVSLA